MSQKKALEGIRIADFGIAGVGPTTSRFLADAGAEVIKVESHEYYVEVMRRGYPFKNGVPGENSSLQFGLYNFNKYAVTFNLKTPKGIDLAKRLVAISDVVTDSFTPGVMDRLGLGYEDLKKVKEDIIMIEMSAAGRTGPLRESRAHGPVLQCWAGLTYLTGWPDRPPMAPSVAWTDYYAPNPWVVALMGALVYRHRTGKGQYIDASDLEAAVDALDTAIADYDVNGRVAERRGNRHPYAAPHGCYQCKGDERWCVIAVFSDEEWENLCKALGNPAWANDESLSTMTGRLNNQDRLDDLISQWTRERSAEDVMHTLQKAGVRAGVVQNAPDLYSDPQLKHREHYWELKDDPDREWFSYEAPPFRLSKTPPGIRMKRPLVGEHNHYVCCDLLGVSDSEFVKLIDEGAIY